MMRVGSAGLTLVGREIFHMEYIVSAEEMKRYDQAAIHKIGIPAMVLIERAALSTVEEIVSRLGGGYLGNVLVLCGYGNNGADGLAVARLLSEKGGIVTVICCGREENASAEWICQRRILENYPVDIGSKFEAGEYNILIDALFGVGLSREVQGEYAGIIEKFNISRGMKVSLDLPSGIHSDTGQVMGCAVKSQLTVTFAFPKKGLLYYPGCVYAGEITVKDIGIGDKSFFAQPPGMFRYTEEPWELLPGRMKQGNKGTFGKVLIAAGSRRMAGAAVLAARGCFRAGAGMVKVISHSRNRDILLNSIPEAMFGEYGELEESFGWAGIMAAGPGLDTGREAASIVENIIGKSTLPLILDADALNILAVRKDLRQEIGRQGREGRSFILTPHLGEMARLLGQTAEELKKIREESVIRLASELNCVIVCKDARTLTCAPGKPVCMNTSGNSGMAAAGSGDVLTGIIAGLAAQGMEVFEAASAGAYLHGRAGDIAAKRLGLHAMTAGNIAEAMCCPAFHRRDTKL